MDNGVAWAHGEVEVFNVPPVATPLVADDVMLPRERMLDVG